MNTFLEHYREILTDPAHLAVEVTLMLLVDVLFLSIVWPWIKRHIHRDITQNESDVPQGVPVLWDGERFTVGGLDIHDLVSNEPVLLRLVAQDGKITSLDQRVARKES